MAEHHNSTSNNKPVIMQINFGAKQNNNNRTDFSLMRTPIYLLYGKQDKVFFYLLCGSYFHIHCIL